MQLHPKSAQKLSQLVRLFFDEKKSRFYFCIIDCINEPLTAQAVCSSSSSQIVDEWTTTHDFNCVTDHCEETDNFYRYRYTHTQTLCGGKGGNGGNGGNGGLPGNLIASSSLDLINLKPSSNGGKGGLAGPDGNGYRYNVDITAVK